MSKNDLEKRKIHQEEIEPTFTIQDLYDYYKNEESLDYLKNNAKVLNCSIQEGLPFYGCFPIEKNNILIRIVLCVPPINNLESMLINIHEYKHGIRLYPFLGKKLNYNAPEEEQIASDEEQKFKNKILKKS